MRLSLLIVYLNSLLIVYFGHRAELHTVQNSSRVPQNGGVPGPPTRNPRPRIQSCRGHIPPQSAVSLSVGCLFLRSPSRVPYRTELIPRLSVDCLFFKVTEPSSSETRLECRISKCRISIQSTSVPLGCLTVVQKLTESRFGISKFGIPIEIRR